MVESTIENALEAVGAGSLSPTVLLVGVPTTTSSPQLVVEPESLRAKVSTSLSKALNQHSFSPSASGGFPQLPDLLASSLKEITGQRAQHFFCSAGGEINGYQVFTCIGVDANILGTLNALSLPDKDHEVNLPTEIIRQVLKMADDRLALAEPGHGTSFTALTSYDWARRAARSLVEHCAVSAGSSTGNSLFDHLDALTSHHYEGAAASGRITLAPRDHPALQNVVLLDQPIPIRYIRSLRKLLEISDQDISMLCDGEHVFGFGTVLGYQSSDQNLFEIRVDAHATWELRHCKDALMRVEYGKPALLKQAINRAEFDAIIRLKFENITDVAVDNLWAVVKSAVSGSHGTMLVISADAQREAKRLSGQATLLKPALANSELISHVTRIDGAVMLDPMGVCHAIGVILDGTATNEGDPSRGARFNSAVRYLASQKLPAVAVVASADGAVDVLPRLKSLATASAIEEAVSQLHQISHLALDAEAFARAYEDVQNVAASMTETQRAEVAEITAHYHRRQVESGHQPVKLPVLAPTIDEG